MKKILFAIAFGAGLLHSATSEAQTLIGTANSNSIFTMDNVSPPNSISDVPSSGTTGITTLHGNIANALLVYPNPVTSSTRIALPAPSIGTVSVKVIDLNGVVKRSYEYVPGISILDVDMSRLPTGLYSVRVFGTSLDYYNLKVVKQ